MPEMDGYGVLEHVFNEGLNAMVVVISGDIQPEARDRVLKLGAIDFIKKPVSKEKLGAVLAEYGLMES
jgi:FixJ family two-component response regulator